MALKGSAVIELTDTKTGEKEIVKHDNLVTNAVNDILSGNPLMYQQQASFGINSDLLPVVPNLIGGVLLFEKPIDEDADKYYVGASNKCTGYANNAVNSGTDTKRGSLNLTESGKLDDGSGYRFVFDFATSQGNGEISALSLTSKYGGIGYQGSMETAGSRVYAMFTHSFTVDSYAAESDESMSFNSIVSVNSENSIMYAAWLSGVNEVSVAKIKTKNRSIGLFEKFTIAPSDVVEISKIATTNFGSMAGESKYYTFVDGGDRYIWGFHHGNGSAGNSSGTATVVWIKISKEDWTFEEGTWSVAAPLYRFGYHDTRNVQNPTICNYAVISGGYLYCRSYDGTAIYKIEINNPANVKKIMVPDGETVDATVTFSYHVSGNSYNYSNVGTLFNVIGNTIIFKNGFIEDDEVTLCTSVISSTSSDNWVRGIQRCAKPGLKDGPFLLTFRVVGYTVYCSCYLPTAYLATINNLEKPVQKTADKTMKITYILREE